MFVCMFVRIIPLQGSQIVYKSVVLSQWHFSQLWDLTYLKLDFYLGASTRQALNILLLGLLLRLGLNYLKITTHLIWTCPKWLKHLWYVMYGHINTSTDTLKTGTIRLKIFWFWKSNEFHFWRLCVVISLRMYKQM